MESFDYKKMEEGAYVVTRDGRAATFVKYDHRDKTYPLCICIDGELLFHWFSLDGISANESCFDLFIKS